MDHLRALRVLGLPPGAGADEIRAAWRDLAKVWHPDRFPHDERLRRKAGENLQRINEAHEALRDYDPAKTPRLAERVRASVAIILGMGELGQPPAAPASPATPPPAGAPTAPLRADGPIGRRHSLRILGLGVRRPSGRRRRASGRTGRRLALALLVLTVLAVLVFVAMRLA